MADRITIVVDRREQRPWRFSSAAIVELGTLHGGDYSVEGYEDLIGIERKSLGDLVGSLTTGRERFGRALAALSACRWRAIIVEAPLCELLCGAYRSRATPTSMLGSVAAICADGVPIMFADDANCAAALAERLLVKFAKRAAAAREEAAA